MSLPQGGVRLAISSLADLERVRREARALAHSIGLDREDSERVVLAVSELGTNLLRYAQAGELAVRRIERSSSVGIEVESTDHGPGIADVEQAMQEGFSTGGGLGSGLPGVRRLMDELAVESGPTGTRIVCRTWRRGR